MGYLRFLLAFSVMSSHIRPKEINRIDLLDGGLAVIVFFMISGFYMSMVLTEKYLRLPDGRWRFFVNRLLRIYPLYFVALLMEQAKLSLDGMKTVFTSDLGYSAGTRGLLIAMNLSKFGQDYWQTLGEVFSRNHRLHVTSHLEEVCRNIFGSTAFDLHPGTLLVGQGWSLASELTYYLLAPFVVGSAWPLAAGAAVLSLAVRFGFKVTLGMDYMDSVRMKFFPTVLVFFLIGHCAYRLHVRASHWKYRRHAERVSVASWISLLIYALSHCGFLQGLEYDSLPVWLFYLFAALSMPFLFSATKDSSLDTFVGEFSYPIYLIHPVINQFDFFHMTGSPTVHYLNIVVGNLLVSYLLIRAVERPVNRFRARIAVGVNAPSLSEGPS